MEALPTPSLQLVVSPCPHQHLLLPAWPWSLLLASPQGQMVWKVTPHLKCPSCQPLGRNSLFPCLAFRQRIPEVGEG